MANWRALYSNTRLFENVSGAKLRTNSYILERIMWSLSDKAASSGAEKKHPALFSLAVVDLTQSV